MPQAYENDLVHIGFIVKNVGQFTDTIYVGFTSPQVQSTTAYAESSNLTSGSTDDFGTNVWIFEMPAEPVDITISAGHEIPD